MRTPGASRSESNSLAPAVRKCVFCDQPLGPGRVKFCSDQHRWADDSNARQALVRVNKLFSRRELIRGSLATALVFALHLESRPDSPGDRRSHTASVLHELDLLLSHRGPNDPAVRSFVRVQADAVRLAFEAEPSRNIEDCRQYVRALEILRDAGSENLEDTETLLQYGRAAVKFYAGHGDYLNSARSLQALANTHRLNQNERRGTRLTRYAWHILNEKFSRSNDTEVLTIVHQSAFWDLRLSADTIGRPAAEEKCRQIIGLAESVNTPAIWIETHRELAGHFGKDGEREDESRHQLQQLDKVRKENPGLTAYGNPTLLRPQIELLLGSGRKRDKDEGIHLIETGYLDLYKSDRHVYYHRQLMKWNRQHGLSLQLPSPAYASPILVHLPRCRE